MKNQFPSFAEPPVSLQEDAWQLVVENFPEAVFFIDRELRLVCCNQQARNAVWDRRGVHVYPGMQVLQLLPPPMRESLSEMAADVLRGQTRSFRSQPAVEAGNPDTFEHAISPARNAEGEIVGLLVRSTDITERYNAEEAIREAEERWQFAFEASNQAAWDWNLQTNEVIYSTSYKKMYGFVDTDLTNDVSEWQIRIHPDDRKRIELALEEHLRADDPHYETTYRIQLKDGSYKWILARGRVMGKDAQGRPLRMIGTHTDLTKTLEAKAEIRRMNERFYYAAKASLQALWEWNAQTGEAYVSSSFTNVFGWRADENRRFEQWHQYIHPNERRDVVSQYYRTLETPGQNIWQATYRFLKADGSYAIVNDKAYILRDEKGAVLKVIGATQDVTALKKAEEELRRSNERYHTVLKATNELIWEWDLKTGEVYRPTESIQKVYGLPDDTEVKTVEQWLSRIHPDDLAGLQRHMAAIATGEHMQTFEMEYRFRRGDGGYNDLCGRGILIKNEQGEPVRMFGAEKNISERKRLERELLARELEMKKRINQATVDSQERERSEIGRELHDNVNQVLTTTKLYLELALCKKEMTDELVARSSEKISEVINLIRRLSRSLMDPMIDDLGIAASLRDLVETLNLTGKFRIGLDIDDLIENVIDKNCKLTIFRIVQESLNNVVKHAEASFVNIAIRLLEKQVQIVIADDGIGFDPVAVKKGAGLQNINNRVYLVNGHLHIDSSPGMGCKIIINFPIR